MVIISNPGYLSVNLLTNFILRHGIIGSCDGTRVMPFTNFVIPALNILIVHILLVFKML